MNLLAAETTTGDTNPMNQIINAVKDSFIQLGFDIANFFPKLIIAAIILFVGIMVAKILRTMFTKVFEGIKLDDKMDKSGTKSALAKMGISGSMATAIPKFIYFFIVFLMVKIAADSAGFTDVSNFINTIFAFLPKLITAFIIMVVGIVIGEVIRNTVFNVLDAKGIDYAGSLAKVVYSLVFIIFLTVSLSQIGIETQLLKAGVIILLCGLSIAMALSLGLGLKNHAYNIVAAVYVRDIYRNGAEIEIEGELLTVSGVGPITTKLSREDGSFIILPNSSLINTKVRGTSKG